MPGPDKDENMSKALSSSRKPKRDSSMATRAARLAFCEAVAEEEEPRNFSVSISGVALPSPSQVQRWLRREQKAHTGFSPEQRVFFCTFSGHQLIPAKTKFDCSRSEEEGVSYGDQLTLRQLRHACRALLASRMSSIIQLDINMKRVEQRQLLHVELEAESKDE